MWIKIINAMHKNKKAPVIFFFKFGLCVFNNDDIILHCSILTYTNKKIIKSSSTVTLLNDVELPIIKPRVLYASFTILCDQQKIIYTHNSHQDL